MQKEKIICPVRPLDERTVAAVNSSGDFRGSFQGLCGEGPRKDELSGPGSWREDGAWPHADSPISDSPSYGNVLFSRQVSPRGSTSTLRTGLAEGTVKLTNRSDLYPR